MITPEFLSKVVEEIERKYADLNNDMVKRIARKVVSVFSHNPKNTNDILKFTAKDNVYDDMMKAVHDHTDEINNEIKQAYLKSANEISNHNTELVREIAKENNITIPEYKNNSVKASQLNLTDNEVKMVESAYKKAQSMSKNLTRTMPSAGQNTYIEACNNAFLKVKAGQSLDDALVSAIDEMAQKGITVVSYDSGRRDRIEVAIARAVRTGINQMNGELVLQRCAEMGLSYVQVSQHLGARDLGTNDFRSHVTFQGKVFSIDWDNDAIKAKGFSPVIEDKDSRFKWLEMIRDILSKDKKKEYPDFVTNTGYGDVQGILGVNCRHTIRAFIPGVNQEEPPLNQTENRIQYEAEQKARRMEREIRATKREIDALEYSGLDNKQTEDMLFKLKNKLSYQQSKYKSHMLMYDKEIAKWRTTTVQDFLKNPSKYSIMNIEKDYSKMIKKRKIIDNSELENGLPIEAEPYSIIDKVIENKVMQRRVYGRNGMALYDYDLNDHGLPSSHPTYSHKHIMNYSKKNVHGEPLPLTDSEIILNRDIIQKGVNYFEERTI